MNKLITIDFHDDTLFALETPDGVFVAIKPICDTLGIDWKAQRNRIDRSAALAKGRVVMTLPSPGGAQDQVCLRLDLVNGWLFGIDAERVTPEARPRVLAYQDECCRVLFQHFYGRRAVSADPAVAESVGKRRQLVTECRHAYGVKAAQELWRKLDLPMVPAMNDPGWQSTMPLTFGGQGGK